ncbi:MULTISPECIES: hypothetical protein [Streptomyces rochei group]|uniref:hypothetical protein n=1 Tax=Streptomyces rochei group TaxID=2867164 RepID=UPI00187383EF|nr:hypothetical protein [Streptomyces vinaceusdrappus]GHB98605.1 hypothetical protein GCM10010308_07520 [Streptomyces vinaceusdrappus]
MSRARVRWNAQPANRAARAGALRGLGLGGEHLLEVSNRRIPIEEGTLERSGTVTVDEANLDTIVSYDTPYSVRQHEDLTLRHDEGREAKFLEKSLDEEGAVILDLIAAEVRRSLRG